MMETKAGGTQAQAKAYTRRPPKPEGTSEGSPLEPSEGMQSC